MNAPKPKFNLRKEDILKKIKENPEFYNSRDNAVNTYNLVLRNYKLIKFKSNSEQIDFNRHIKELKKAILIESKELFKREFAKVTCIITFYLKKSIL